MKSTDPIQLTATLEIPSGPEPIVLVGANGAGKTMLGVQIAANGATRISARRALDMPHYLHPQAQELAEGELANAQNQLRTERSAQHADFNQTLGVLLAEERSVACRSRRLRLKGEVALGPEPEIRIDRVSRIWGELFPGRELSFEGDKASVTATHRANDKVPYLQNQMSDGERQVLYLASRVATAPPYSVLVVDEPEIHLHSFLARRLWNALEEMREDCRFVYVTHDLPFAQSRLGATLVVCRADGNHEIVRDIPGDIFEDILGAISFPVKCEHVIFCEGTTNSLDYLLFEAWFEDANIAVKPVGGCDTVGRCVAAIRAGVGRGMDALGIVDRDARCADEIRTLEEQRLHVLAVAEVEHLYCVGTVFRAVLVHLGEKDIFAKEDELRVSLSNEMLLPATVPRLVLERAQDHIRWAFKFPPKKISPGSSLDTAAQALTDAHRSAVEAVEPASAFSEAQRLIREAAAGSLDDILRVYTSKSVLETTAKIAGVTSARYTQIVQAGLSGRLGLQIRGELRKALEIYMPKPTAST